MTVLYEQGKVTDAASETAGIYYWKNLVNGKGYVGQSLRLRERLGRYVGMHFKTQRAFYGAVKKHGLENFTCYKIRDCCPSKVALNYWETYYINKLNTLVDNGSGYNLTTGGDSSTASVDTLLRLSKVNKDKWKRKSYRDSIADTKRITAERRIRKKMEYDMLIGEYRSMRSLSSTLQLQASKDRAIIGRIAYLNKWNELSQSIRDNYLLKYSITNPLHLPRSVRYEIRCGKLKGTTMSKFKPKKPRGLSSKEYGKMGANWWTQERIDKARQFWIDNKGTDTDDALRKKYGQYLRTL